MFLSILIGCNGKMSFSNRINITLFTLIFALSINYCRARDQPRLLIISFDGFRWDYLQKANKAGNFHRIIREGVISRHGLKNAFITKTLPNHYTLVTGLYEENHGLVGNSFFDPKFNRSFSLNNKDDNQDWRWFDMGAEPIWVTNQKRGTEYRSGSVFWAGSAASVDGILPTKYLEFEPKNYSFNRRVDTIVEWLNDNKSINLGLLYFGEPDHTGHKFGPDSPEIQQKIEELDEVLGYLLKQLELYNWLPLIDIIVTSDHGMTSTPPDAEHEIDLDRYIRPDSYNIYTANPIADLHPLSKELEEEIYKNLSNAPHLTVYKKDEIPPQYHYSRNRRIAPILAVADEHYWISHNNSTGSKGNHGYNNSLLSMHPLFIAMGPSFKKNASVEIFNNVDVYPLMCHILKMTPAPNNGTMDVVQHLLVGSSNKHVSSTFGAYVLIITFASLVSGIVIIAACLAQRVNRKRHLRSDIEGVAYSKVDTEPLMNEYSDDDQTTEP